MVVLVYCCSSHIELVKLNCDNDVPQIELTTVSLRVGVVGHIVQHIGRFSYLLPVIQVDSMEFNHTC